MKKLNLFFLLFVFLSVESKAVEYRDNNPCLNKRYSNVSTASSFLKFKFQNRNDKKVHLIIIRNSDLSYYLGGLIFPKNNIIVTQAEFAEFLEKQYIPFLLHFEGSQSITTLEDFPVNQKIVKVFNFENFEKFLLSYEISKELKLTDFMVNNKELFLEKFFEKKDSIHVLKIKWQNDFNNDLAFISFLLGLGYDVFQSDIAPVLSVRICQENGTGQ